MSAFIIYIMNGIERCIGVSNHFGITVYLSALDAKTSVLVVAPPHIEGDIVQLLRIRHSKQKTPLRPRSPSRTAMWVGTMALYTA